MAELKALIDRLHGRVDESPNRRTRAIIAEKINLRFGKGPPAQTPPSSAKPAPSTGRSKVVSAGKSRPPKPSTRSPAQRAAPAPSTFAGKAAAKRERAKKEADRLGITEAELKARRRAENEANRAKRER